MTVFVVQEMHKHKFCKSTSVLKLKIKADKRLLKQNDVDGDLQIHDNFQKTNHPFYTRVALIIIRDLFVSHGCLFYDLICILFRIPLLKMYSPLYRYLIEIKTILLNGIYINCIAFELT